MKATKKIVGAAAALVAAVALSAGSTFAWFAANSSVSATGISVGVTTTNEFLLIGNGDDDTLDEIQDSPSDHITVDFNSSETLMASAFGYNSAGLSSTNLADATKWYYAQAESSKASTAKEGTDTALTGFDGYVSVYTMYVCMAKDSADSTNPLTASVTVYDTSSTLAEGTSSPISVYLVCGTTVVSYISGTESTSMELATKVTDDEVLTITAYVFYDGTNSNVTSDNYAAGGLKQGSVSISLSTAGNT